MSNVASLSSTSFISRFCPLLSLWAKHKSVIIILLVLSDGQGDSPRAAKGRGPARQVHNQEQEGGDDQLDHRGHDHDEDDEHDLVVVMMLTKMIEVIEYIVPDDLLEELGIDEMTYDELKALFELFDLDR